MKLAIVVFALAAYVSAASIPQEPIPIIKQESEVNYDGTYHSSYETGNGISASEQGVVKNANNPDTAVAEVTGSFTYTGDDGVTYTIEYIANENGFQPKGAHIPIPPQIPEAIAKSLEFNAAHPEAEEKTGKN